MPLWYFGAPPTESTSIATVDYVNSLAAQNISLSVAKQEIKNRFSLASYAKNSDASAIINSTLTDQAFARKNDLNAVALTKIPALSSGQNSRANGPLLLDSSGKIDPSLISGVVPTQRYPQMYWTPTNYTKINSSSSEQTICTVPVTSAYSSYKVLVTGTISAKCSVDGEYPVINVRVGGTSGPIVAKGYGVAENYKGGALTVLSTASVPLLGYTQQSTLPSSAYTYQIPPWCDKIDVVLVGGGGGGYDGIAGWINGAGGLAGVWSSTTLVKGSTLPSGAISLTGEIGQGAGRSSPTKNSSGGTTTCIVPGGGTYSANGGATGGHKLNKDGVGPGNTTFGGITYQGGQDATEFSQAGNAPGGGGAGGQGRALKGDDAGNGAAGAAFFYAYVNDDNNYGQISVLPTPMGVHSVLSAPTTLYVTVVRSGSSSQITTDTISPQISVMTVPC